MSIVLSILKSLTVDDIYVIDNIFIIMIEWTLRMRKNTQLRNLR